jgi:hydrogenase maturation protease
MSPQALVYGFGNPGRGDDGLGVAFCEQLERLALPHLAIETNYQLNVEDAATIAEKDIVVFVDASRDEIASFRLSVLQPAAGIEFTTHAMSPGSVLALCHELYARRPAAFVLEIRGYEWELGMPLSAAASRHLDEAIIFMTPLLRHPSVEEFSKKATGES